jgi:hypothetical protein
MILIIISGDENSYENVSVSVVKSIKGFSSIIVEIETLVLYKLCTCLNGLNECIECTV